MNTLDSNFRKFVHDIDTSYHGKSQAMLLFLFQVEVNITDDNVRPYFNQTEYNIEVEENTQLSGLLVAVTALDKKKNEEMICNCTYRLMHGMYVHDEACSSVIFEDCCNILNDERGKFVMRNLCIFQTNILIHTLCLTDWVTYM